MGLVLLLGWVQKKSKTQWDTTAENHASCIYHLCLDICLDETTAMIPYHVSSRELAIKNKIVWLDAFKPLWVPMDHSKTKLI